MQWITALDFQILHEIQNRFSCSFLDFWMPKITALGNGGILWILGSKQVQIFHEIPLHLTLIGQVQPWVSDAAAAVYRTAEIAHIMCQFPQTKQGKQRSPAAVLL